MVTKNNSLCFYRKKILDVKKEKFDATIVVIAYNRPDITRLCIESVLRNTADVNYKLILIFNKSKYGEGILEYFNSVDYENKIVIEIEENNGAPYAYREAEKYFEGDYIVHLPNDVIVTPNWLSNMIKCAKSDPLIGMVNPQSSNVSNLQCVNLEFSDYNEMYDKAEKYNVSDSMKWHERLRLITLGTLFTKECLSAIGPIFDVGFIHDFGDDDVSFRVRRAGYKTILACDTWVHHAHEVSKMENKDPEEFQKSIETGRKNFREKYFGVDAWEDVNNYVYPLIGNSIDKPQDINDVNILGIDVRCGTPILDIKNSIRKYNIFSPDLSAFSSDSKYIVDLKTICNKSVICDRYDYFKSHFEDDKFDYIIIGNSINSYKNPLKMIKDSFSLLKKGGQLFIKLKNTYSIMSLLFMMGYFVEHNDNDYVHLNVDTLCSELKEKQIDYNLVNCELHQVNDEIIKYASQIINYAKSDSFSDEDLLNRLMVDKYWIKITK